MNKETELRMKCLELALAENGGSTERAVAAADAYFNFVMDRTPSAHERSQPQPSNNLHV